MPSNVQVKDQSSCRWKRRKSTWCSASNSLRYFSNRPSLRGSMLQTLGLSRSVSLNRLSPEVMGFSPTSNMSASTSESPSKSTTRTSSHKQKKSEEVDPQRKRPSTASRPQSVDRFTEEVRDAQSREARDGGDPGIKMDSPLPPQVLPIISKSHLVNRGNGDAQSREAGGGETPTVAVETPSITLFQGSSNFQISNTKFTAIGGDATIIQFGDGQFTEIQRNLICDYIATLTALPHINDNFKKHFLTQLIILLPRAEAVFNDYQTKKKSGPCFEGTRVALLREMANWVTSSDESRMYILSGLAGIGKSTVAYTIASRAADLNLLGASFFFSRDEADRNNAKKLFTTIAYQLCVYNETFATAIGDVLLTESGSAATTKDPQEQLQVLILDPLRSIVQSCARPIVVVVDALDECCEDDVRAVVEGLSQLVRDLPSFKVILTTRPLPYLDYFLGNQGGHKLFHLQDIESKVVDGDIRLYLRYNLSLEKIRERYPRRQWYASDEQIDALVRAAGRMFIIASTAVRYILDKSASNPATQMQKLLRACAQDHTPFKDLDHFYTVILRNIVPADCDDDDIVSRYQSVVGTIIFVSRPLPVSTLAHLINMDVEDIYAVVEKLQSVILLGDDDVPRIYHKSFPDYLTDQARCKDPCLRIDAKIGHAQIATCCFEITNKHLKHNILGLGDPARFMSNEDGLKKDGITDVQQQEKIPPQLRYACVYWANHLEVANIEDSDLMNGLERFVDEHTLHWFEVLSLIGDLNSAHRAIRIVLKLLKSSSPNLYQLLSDALRFISKFYEIINRSILHTYYSALPFTPTDSLLYRRSIKEAEHDRCGIEGGPKKWDALVTMLNHGEHVHGIKFSLDSALLFSYSREYLVGDIRKEKIFKIWDAATGTPISTISGHSFAVTNGFSTVASSENNVITYYNVGGSARSTTITTSSTIEELALSESSRVAAALSDGTVWLWDSGNAELICKFDGFGGYWSRLKFSTTGTRLAYSSAIGFIKLWDGISGRFIADLQCGSPHGFAFSHDGSRIVSLSRDCGLTLWNTESGGLVGAVRDVGHGLNALAISANGSLLATADYWGRVTLWSDNGDLAKIKVLESTDPKPTLTFSLNNILAIGTRDGIQLYNINTHSFMSTLSYSGSRSTALAFSPDCTHLAGGFDSGNMYLWDIRGIDASSPSSQETTFVTATALSRDCSRLACGFVDGTIELRETSPTKRRIASHQGHWASLMEFGPDGRLFASGSYDGTIKLWNAGDGSLHGTLNASDGLQAVALSGSVLVAAGSRDVTLWSLDTLSLTHTFQTSSCYLACTASISDDSDLAAIGFLDGSVHLIDVMNRTTLSLFTVFERIHKLTFLPDKSQLVAQTHKGDFLSLNLINNCVTNGPTLEHLIQLPDIPLWHGVPVWPCSANEQHYVAALFSQYQTPVPVLWIPSDIPVNTWIQGSSMIALHCRDRRIILLRLPAISADRQYATV
ncbi:hypothetical protein M378DRAFT_677182 [Amanita muscaria Koide BX008]|uniref:NACHT domain-containing protein n=1 Tax=Amanita muscaria (strain Koide BX008) TaxID=946122 RepID=A0A0C2T9L6_AMAMK|nr:hypothetical protein M378DRAFT_677182 [Amanita muscaria Koide BX008]